MKIGIFYDDGDLFVSFNNDKFAELLDVYIEKYGNSRDAIKQIEKELKQETLTK